MISSTANARIKAITALRKRRVRDAERRFLVEGSRPLSLALDAKWPILEVLFTTAGATDHPELLDKAANAGVQTTHIAEPVMKKIAYRTEPEGVIAVAAHRPFELDSLPRQGDGVYLVTEAIEKPGNIGAMLRTADAAGVTALIAADGATDLTNPNVVRASQGALFTVPVASASAGAALAWLTDAGLRSVATVPDASTSLWDCDLTGGIAVVIGSERDGLSSVWANSEAVRIPMRGAADSLNASTAAALVIYEAQRQRR